MKKVSTRFPRGIAMLMLVGACAPGVAQVYPDKPVRVIVPVPAGGNPDVTARLLTPGLSRLLGQQFVVDNRAGAGSLIGADLAAKASPDGYTLLISSGGPLTILPHVQKRIPYDPLRDFAPVSLISGGPFVLIARPSAPFRSVKDLVAMAKAAPGKFFYASAGNGSPNHLGTELFKIMAGIDITHVPYKGAPQGVTDVVAGQIDLNFSSIPPVLQHIRAGRVLALAVSGARRSAQLPEVPTVSETVAKGYDYTSWFGLLAPAGTPQPVIAKLNQAVVQVVNGAEMKGMLESLGAEPLAGTPAQFGAWIRREYESNGKTAKIANIRID